MTQCNDCARYTQSLGYSTLCDEHELQHLRARVEELEEKVAAYEQLRIEIKQGRWRYVG